MIAVVNTVRYLGTFDVESDTIRISDPCYAVVFTASVMARELPKLHLLGAACWHT